jgi:hypothetical protein
MWSSPNGSALPTRVAPNFGARLTLPASSSEEAVRGSGRQLRILRAPSLHLLQELVSRELRAHAMSMLGESKSARRRAGSAEQSAVAAEVIAALNAGDFRRAVVTHATGFDLGIDLPPQLGGGIGECLALPAPKPRHRVVLEETEDLEPETPDVPAAA